MKGFANGQFGLTLLLLLVAIAARSTVTTAQDLTIEGTAKELVIKPRQNEGQAFYPLSAVADVTGCHVQTQKEEAVISGPAGDLHLTAGRALVRSGNEYILLSSAPWKTEDGEWYVAEDFVARALSLILVDSLRSVGPLHYRLGHESTRVELELINRPDQVRVILRPRKYTSISLLEYSDRIEVTFGASELDIQFPRMQPNPQIVTSISEVDENLVISKGPQFDRFEDSQPMTGPGMIVDLYGVPSTIVRLPPRSSPSPLRSSDEDAGVVEIEPALDGLLDWPTAPGYRKRISVVLDPGHGGDDHGITWGELSEKDIALEIAFRIQDLLETAGHTCQLTRTRDVALPVEKRSGVANYYQPQAFISIHVGASPSSSTRASSVYIDDGSQQSSNETTLQTTLPYPDESLVFWREAQTPYRNQSRSLGRIIQGRLATISEAPAPVIEAPLAVLKAVKAPAVLIEIGYLTNPAQRRDLQSDDQRESIAVAVAESISAFLQGSAIETIPQG